MTDQPSRRRFLGTAAALVGGAASVPVLCSGPAFAGPKELPVVTRPDHPAAEYASTAARASGGEPLNASVSCGLDGRTV